MDNNSNDNYNNFDDDDDDDRKKKKVSGTVEAVGQLSRTEQNSCVGWNSSPGGQLLV